MTPHAWTVIGYVALMLAILALVGMLGAPQMDYTSETEIELVRVLREVALLAAGYVFGAARRAAP